MVDFVGSSCKHEVNMNISLIHQGIIHKINRFLVLCLCDIYLRKDITCGLPDFISS